MTATSTPQQSTVERTSATPDAAGNRAIIAILLVATFVVILNETIMNVALPRLMEDLGVTARTGQWLATVFMLTLAIVIPTTGYLLQRLTTRQVFVAAMTLFSAGTLLAAVSPAFWLLLPARVVQASGTAMMLPLLITTILRLVPVERRGVVMGNVTVVISVAPAIGPDRVRHRPALLPVALHVHPRAADRARCARVRGQEAQERRHPRRRQARRRCR